MTGRPSAVASVAVAGALLLGGARPALATEAGAAEVARLAARAGSDPAALRSLRAIDRVDGRPVRLARALDGARGRVLAARLRTLSASSTVSAARALPAATARREARAILAEDRFRGSSLPRPLREPLARLGAALERIFAPLLRRVPGGEATGWVVLGGLVVGVAIVVSTRVARRRVAGGGAEGRAPVAGVGPETPAELERVAEEAERRGEPAEALRLRFRAGLLRLDAAGAIRLRPSMTAGEVARSVRSPTLSALARDFDEVAYGGAAAGPERVDAARRGWPVALREAAAR